MGVTLNFDATQVDPRQSNSICLPLADYPVEIVKTEPIPVKDNPNKGMLRLTLKVLDGPAKGVEQQDNLNLFNDNEVAVRIAYQRLAAYCYATGKLGIGDSDELVGGRCICQIGPQLPPQEKYSEVKFVKNMDGSLPTAGQGATPQQHTQQSAAPFQQAAPTQAQAQPTWNNPAQAAAPPANAWQTGNAQPANTSGKPSWVK